MSSSPWKVLSHASLLMLAAISGLGCQTRRSPSEVTATESLALESTLSPSPAVVPSTSGTLDHAFGPASVQATPALPYESIAMALPQPVAEPTPEEDPSQYVAADPPWPRSFTEVYGSELVQKIEREAHSRGLKGVLINAWASWCGPCKTEMPMLLQIRKRYLDKGIDVWFVSVDKPEQAERVAEVLAERSVPKPHYVVKGRLGYFKEAISPIWKGSLPSTFLFDAEGRVRYYWGAHVFENEMTPLLEDFLDGRLVDGVANFKVRRGPPSP